MNLEAFEAALKRTRLSESGRATYGAMLVLVDRVPIATASSQAQCSHQAISTAIARIRRATGECPYCGARARIRSRGS